MKNIKNETKSPFGGLGAEKSPSEGGVGEAWCPIKSRLKMVIFTKAGYDNKTWYSLLSKDKKNLPTQAQKMIERAKRHFQNTATMFIIYDNQTKQEFLRHKL